MRLWLIRHGRTAGNDEGRYVGRTDEPLSEAGRRQLEALKASGVYDSVRRAEPRVYVSPMKRCRETAALFFPEADCDVADGLRECDFGDFEYKNYKELKDNSAYQAWIDSGGRSGFPNGESLETFCGRVTAAFMEILNRTESSGGGTEDAGRCGGHGTEDIVLVAHGGTLMAILDAYARPHRDYFNWQVKNGCGYELLLDREAWQAGNQYLMVANEIQPSEGAVKCRETEPAADVAPAEAYRGMETAKEKGIQGEEVRVCGSPSS